jgi:putative DNA primase/helicase
VTVARKDKIGFPLTDSGNAELIASRFSNRLLYNHRLKKWLMWENGSWAVDRTESVYLLAKEAVRSLVSVAEKLRNNDDLRTKILKWAVQSESRPRLDSAINLAKKEPALANTGEDWDANPFLFCVQNGVIDLRSGELRPSCADDHMLLRSPVSHDPEAKCLRFERFLNEVFVGDVETIRFIQKAIGYCLTGSTKEQCIFMCFGEGANGKSTFLEVCADLLGAYSHTLPITSFEKLSSGGSIPNDLAGLVSKRFATASETNDDMTLNEARIKSLTGEDTLSVRFLYGEFFSFKPIAKYWLAFNHKPKVKDRSHGLWRRIRLIDFPERFDGVKRDGNLAATLRNEMPGILNWAIEGCLLWQKEGLGMAPSILFNNRRLPIAPKATLIDVS